jgi:hypothetical protein
MQKRKAIIAGLLATVFLATSVSSATARWYHHRGPGPVLGLLGVVGAVVVGAATIATAPIAIIADAGRAGPPPRDYYGPPPPRYYDRRDRGYYGPPPRYYGY